jgi:aryl-alcohol dehydrogenase-like predicted oxidoreductase
MMYRKLGKTGVTVSEIGFGAWGIGGAHKQAKAYGETDDQESKQALCYAYEQGITFYDTSPLYGFGHSETLIGDALHSVRDHIIIASKVGYTDFSGTQNFSPEYIRQSLEESLQRLQTDYVDVFQLHDPPLDLLEKEDLIWTTLQSLQQEGKIRQIGISTKTPQESLIAIKNFAFDSVQVNFNLVDQRVLDNGLLDTCLEKGVAVIGRTPLCFGFLTGKYQASDSFSEFDHRRAWSNEQMERWASACRLFVNELSNTEKQTNAQVALRFCLSHPAISTIIPGMLTVQQVEENIKSGVLGTFSAEVMAKFREIYQGTQFFI